MDDLRDTAYAREMARATLDVPDGDVRIERLYVKGTQEEEIRFSWWPNGRMANKPLDVPESMLLELIKRAIKQKVFKTEFLRQLKALLNGLSELD